jgi:tetratricopeptide (TPR) repeat protein
MRMDSVSFRPRLTERTEGAARFCVKFGLILLFVTCCSLALVSYAWGQTESVASVRRDNLTAKDAKALEEGLNLNPDNLAARDQLIRYYFEETLTSQAPELEEKRDKHIFWLIEHHPESEMAGEPETDIVPTTSESMEAYQRGRQLWLQAVDKHPDNQRILCNAAQFVLLFDRKIGQELLEKAVALDPGDVQAGSKLAQSYELERAQVTSLGEKTSLVQKALSVRERGLERADSEHRFYELKDLAFSAFEAGEIAKAQQYASELLQAAPEFKHDWNYGNARHNGNIILGRIALRRDDIAGAKEHLLAAGQTPGSPQLNSFGPNMILAKELLEKNERDVVLAYLESCEKFWKMDRGKLQSWIAAIKGGGTPDFGANLLY